VGKALWDLVVLDHAGISPAVLALPPVLLEAEFDKAQHLGQDVPGLDG
jgi:hypothetical protein